MRRFSCPYGDGSWLELPDEWLGSHAVTRETAEAAAKKNGLTGDLSEFAVCLAMAENFSLPGLEGKPEKWDFAQLPLKVIAWVNALVGADFYTAYAVPKAIARASLSGHAQKTPEKQAADTSQTETTSTPPVMDE